MFYNSNFANLAIVSVYRGYQLNDYQNGYKMPIDSIFTLEQNEEGDSVLPDGIQTPGFISGIPICGADQALYNWLYHNVSAMLHITRSKLTLAAEVPDNMG